MKPTDHLQQLAQTDWTAATTHPFTDALADGTLPAEKMVGYLVQDYKFVDGFVRLLASAIAHAPSLADAVPAAQFLGLVTSTENTYFLRSFAALDVQAWDDVPAASVTVAFQDLMAKAAQSGRYEQMLAVLVVAEWSYLSWAAPHAPADETLPFWLGEWITLHAGEGFESVVSYLRDQLDQAWAGLDETARRDVERTFTQAVALERQFFDAAWEGFAL